MATFYYNRYSGESVSSQWVKYIQTESYIGDIAGIVSQNRRDLQKTIENASAEQQEAMLQVCGNLDAGFGEIGRYLEDINSNITELRGEISEMAAMLDWKLSLMIEEQRLTNQYLGHIAQLLRIPDSQKQRVYFIEQGLKYLKNAIIEKDTNSTFYVDALESFSEAEKIERKDFITLNRIGQIYLNCEKYMNFPLAEEYFLKSAREAFAESNAGGTTVSNQFIPLGLGPSVYSEHPFKVATAEAYIYAGRACYLQHKIDEASDLAERAYSLVPEFLKAGFDQAKYLAASNNETEAADVLATVIRKDRLFYYPSLSDGDLNTRKPILKMLGALQTEAFCLAQSELARCKSKIFKTNKVDQIISDIARNIEKKEFLCAMRALDMLKANYPYTYRRIVNSGANEEIVRYAETLNLKLVDYIEKEKEDARALDELTHKIKRQIITSRVLTFGASGAGIGFLMGLCASCNTKTLSMDWGNLFLVTVVVAGIAAFFGYLIGTGKEPRVHDH